MALVLGLIAVGVGVAITAKPFTSVGVLVALVAVSLFVTGIGEIACSRSSLALWAAIASIAAGVAVAAWPDLTIRGLAVVAGIALLAGGVLRLASGFRAGTDERLLEIGYSGPCLRRFWLLSVRLAKKPV